ncbi:MAG: Ig-like domain-containing protein, partial [Pseudomonadota bacterium]
MNLDDDANFEQPQDEPTVVGPLTNDVAAGPDGVITLPAGASISDISAEGRDLVITLADGSRIVTPDGAVFVPQIIIDGVTVPPQTVAQLLADNEPEPAAGPPQSSGGNFADDEGEIQAAFEIGNLLPFTDFSFPAEEEEEIFPTLGDEEPTIAILTPDDPIGSQDAVASVGEAGLPTRGAGEPAGTNEPSDAETTTGTIAFVSPDGPNTVLINGTAVTAPGQTIETPLGTLTIVSINPDAGTIEYSYTLGDNTTDPAVNDVFDVTIVDDDGDQASATLTINIIDDAPIANDDTDEVPAGTFEPITGDVLTNDIPGADGYPVSGPVTGFANEGGTAGPGETLQGEYGTLTINSDGTYSYVRDPNTPGGVEESFDYTIIDDDGSASSATLTIAIGDAPPTIDFVPGDDPDGGEGGPGADDGTLVDEAGLPAREGEAAGSGEIADGDANNDSDPSETTGSTIEFTSADGIGSVAIAGVTLDPDGGPQTIVSDATGTLVVTGFTFDPLTGAGSITYEYTLADNTSGDDTSVTFDLAVTDLDGDIATDELTINIADDVPEAVDDFAAQIEENAPVTVDAFA